MTGFDEFDGARFGQLLQVLRKMNAVEVSGIRAKAQSTWTRVRAENVMDLLGDSGETIEAQLLTLDRASIEYEELKAASALLAYFMTEEEQEEGSRLVP